MSQKDRLLKDLSEAERKKAMATIAEIDDLRIPQNNHFMKGEFDQAIKIAQEMIELAKRENISYLIEEQEEYIKLCLERQQIKEKIQIVRSTAQDLEKKYDALIEENKIIEAHELAEEFKQNNYDFLARNPIIAAKLLISKDSKTWGEFSDSQKKIQIKLQMLENQFNEHLQNNNLEGANYAVSEAKELVPQLQIEDVKEKWETIEKQYQDHKANFELITKIETSLDETIKLKDESKFEDAIKILDSIVEEIKDKDFPVYKEKLNTTKQEILHLKEDYDTGINKIKELENRLRENQEKGNLNVVLSSCKKIIQIATSIGLQETVETYSHQLTQIEADFKEYLVLKEKEQAELIEKAKELKDVIQTDENVLPLLETLSVDDAIGDLSDDIDEMLGQIGGLLNDHRVEVKSKVSNKALLRSASGEVIELENEMEVKQSESPEEPIQLSVLSGITNPFDDVIEEAILTDLIPYNFEISSIQYNGQPVEKEPEKLVVKDGLEVKWELQNIPPKEKVEIKYDLRRRVSRTIIFILKGELKIIKTHSNIAILELEGIYEAKIPFANSFGAVLDGLIIEDIIPVYYIHVVKEPENRLPDATQKSERGNLVKWNIGKMEESTLSYYYKLQELYKFEEMRIKVNDLNSKGLESIENGDIGTALKNFQNIKEQILNFIE